MYESNLEYTLSDKYDPYFEKTLQNIFRIPAIIYVFLPSAICHLPYKLSESLSGGCSNGG